MGIDIKDITDILPFILNNLPECAYIIIISIILGFFIGRQVEKTIQKKKINELKLNQEEEIKKVTNKNNELEKELQQMSQKCEAIESRIEPIKNGQINSNFTSLSSLEKLLDSKEGHVELTALIELNYKKNK